MKALIIMKEAQCGWLREIIPNQHPGMMPLCNKPLLEYLLDFTVLCGCDHIRFVMDSPDSGLEDYFGNGSRWGVALSYSPARTSDDLDTTLKKNSRFCEDTSLLILDGFFFIRHSKSRDYSSLATADTEGPELACSGGSILYRQADESPRLLHTAPADSTTGLLPLESISDFYSITMEILSRDAGHYVLPGYNNEEGVYIGRNVSISKTTTINKPVLLGNNVQLQDHTEIGPGAVIGSNVIVDSGTCIVNSIVMENSYVGAELKIKEKILRSDMAISTTGTVVRFVDDHLLAGLQHSATRGLARVIIHWCLACLFYVTGLIPALVFKLLLKVTNNWQQQTVKVLDRNGRPLAWQAVAIRDDTLTGKLARVLAVDKIIQLPQVLAGRLELVGNKPFPATPEGERQREDFVNYLPGIFYFSEAEGIEEGDSQEEITERFFSANRSLAGDLRVMCKTLLNRW